MPVNHWEPNSDRYGSAGRPSSFFARYLTKRMVVMLVVVFGILGLVFGYIVIKGMIISSYLRNMEQTVSVATTHAQKTSWQGALSAVGSLHAVEGADMAPEVTGIVTRIGFKPGEDVRKGALLVQLRDDSERATYEEAQRNYKRAASLIKTQAISQSDYDAAVAAYGTAKAALVKKAITAPFSGRVGIRQVDVGQYVGAGTVLVTLQQLDPIFVDFTVPQQQLPQLKVGRPVHLVTDVLPGQVFPGIVSAFDPKVDESTRTVRVRATIQNPNKVLLPGMFATVTVEAGQPRMIMTLPQTAITFNTYGNVVFIVKKAVVDGKERQVVEQRFVTTGETRGDQIAILSGISPADVVVSSGGSKLKNGTVVTISNAVRLPSEPNPKPTEEE